MDNAIEPVSGDASPEIAAQSTIAKPTVKPRVDTSNSGLDNQREVTAPAPVATQAAQNQAQQTNDKTAQLAAQRAQREAAEQETLAAQKRAERQKAQVEQKEREAEIAAAKAKQEQQQRADQLKAERQKAQKEKAEQRRAAEEKAKAAERAPTSPSDYVVKRGDGLIRLARQYNVPVEALAQANNIKPNANLHVGQELKIPSRRQIARLEREAEEAKRRAEAAKTAQQRLAEARREAARGEAKGTFGVQVALADNQAKADEVAKKMRAAGYRVSTSPTSRGVRVIVGPETGKPAALALKDKINADPRTGVNNAWVLYWR